MRVSTHFFPGGNTCQGFINYFDGIIPPWGKNERRYILKGGPGVGKNTFMRRFSEASNSHGLEMEYFHCASDLESLDAVRIPELGLTMVDGTAPHIIDPVLPGAEDGIINLGVYLNEAELKAKKGIINKLTSVHRLAYKTTFAYLEAAGSLQKNTNELYLAALERGALQSTVQKIFAEIGNDPLPQQVQIRQLFASAITPQGWVNYLETILGEEKVISLKGPTAIATEVIKLAQKYAEYQGYRCHKFNSPLVPKDPVHLIINDLSFCLATENQYHSENEAVEVIDLTELLDKAILANQQNIIADNQHQSQILLEKAISELQRVKALHDEIEEIYKRAMDFDKATEFSRDFIQQIWPD